MRAPKAPSAVSGPSSFPGAAACFRVMFHVKHLGPGRGPDGRRRPSRPSRPARRPGRGVSTGSTSARPRLARSVPVARAFMLVELVETRKFTPPPMFHVKHPVSECAGLHVSCGSRPARPATGLVVQVSTGSTSGRPRRGGPGAAGLDRLDQRAAGGAVRGGSGSRQVRPATGLVVRVSTGSTGEGRSCGSWWSSLSRPTRPLPRRCFT